MLQIPFHLRYKLSRMQRLTPHLRIWGAPLVLCVTAAFVFLCVQMVLSASSLNVSRAAVFASAIREEEIAYLREAMERGRTPEGIQGVERGKVIHQILRSERKT
jgi:hypothetical protein